MAESENAPEKLLALRAKSIYESIISARLVHTALSEQIDDDIESSDDFDHHPLASYAKNAHSTVISIEQLLIIELSFDLNGKFKDELEKLLVLDVLKGSKNPLRAILNRVNLKK